MAFNDTNVPAAALVAGRTFSSSRSKQAWRELCEVLDQVGLTLVLQTDFPNASDAEPLDASAIVGFKVETTDSPFPKAVSLVALNTSLQLARRFEWKGVETLIGETLSEVPQLWAAPTGPLAGVFVAFGVPARDESEDLEWSAGSPQSHEPNLDFVVAKDTSQRTVSEGIWGVRVLYAGDWCAEPLDVSEEVHAHRVAALRTLGADARYYVMSSFD